MPRLSESTDEETRPDWEGIRDRFIGLDESLSVKSYYPQLKQRLRELEESRAFLEQKSAALTTLLEDFEEEHRKANESEARLQAVFKNLPFAFWSADEKAVIQLANETARDRYGMESGLPLASLPVSDLTRGRLEADFKAAFSGRIERNERFIDEEGCRLWIQTIAAPIIVDGAVNGVLGIDVDITKLKAAEASLAALNEDLETKVSERTGQLQSKIAELKDAQDRLILSEKLAALGRLTAGIAHELNSPLGAIESSSVSLIDIVLRSAAQLPTLVSRLPKDAVTVYFSLLSDSMDYATRLRECGDRKRRGEYAKRLADLGAEQPNHLAEMIDEIDAYDAFEALTEHYGLVTAALILAAAAEGASLVRSATIIRHAAQRASLVLKMLKSYEDSESQAGNVSGGERRSETVGGAEPSCEDPDQSLWAEVDVDRSVSAAVALSRSKLQQGIRLELRLESRAKVRANEASLSQVWINIINNALQAMEYSGVLEIASRRENDSVVVSVVDSGRGIPEENRSRIFEPFFTTKQVGEGIGFGLVIAKRFVDRSGGNIDFESRPGRTEFRVTLPAIKTV